jgi:predicted enzyme related to lactoylglutathione lyase
MKIRYKHTNIVARDWASLAEFYEHVFGCVRVPPERHLSGAWLEKGTGVPGASFSGVHLRLPGHGENGPTLEIFRYARNEEKPRPLANREGFSHIAFEVDDVPGMMERALAHGGSKVGEITRAEVEGVGLLIFVYLADPEGNIIELQAWE